MDAKKRANKKLKYSTFVDNLLVCEKQKAKLEQIRISIAYFLILH